MNETKFEWYQDLLNLYKKTMTDKSLASNLIAEFKPFIDEILPNVVSKSDPDYEDYQQEAYLYIAECALNKDSLPDGQITFFPWMWQTRLSRHFAKDHYEKQINFPDYYEPLPAVEDKLLANQMLSYLNDNQRNVVSLRIGLVDNHPETFQEIGNQLGMSKQRASKIFERAIKIMQEHI